jgi:hypothetical protein
LGHRDRLGVVHHQVEGAAVVKVMVKKEALLNEDPLEGAGIERGPNTRRVLGVPPRGRGCRQS